MSKPKFYLLALYAKKIEPENLNQTPQADGSSIAWEIKPTVNLDTYLSTPISLWALGVVAPSLDIARQRGMDRLIEECPWQDGWIEHYVSVNTVSQASFDRICREATGSPLDVPKTDGDEWPDIIVIDQVF